MITSSVAEGAAPFVGARSFDIDDDRLFHGRRAEAEDLARLWRGNRLTVLHGGAGVGKTSLVCAGAMPLLRAGGERVLRPGRLWRRNAVPTAAFPGQNVFTYALLSSWYPGEPPPSIAGRSILEFLRRHAGRDRFGLPVRTFAVIDEAELLVRRPVAHREERRRFIGQLAEAMAAEANLYLLLAVREECLDEVRELGRRLAGEEGACYGLGALGRAAAVEAVGRPFGEAGLRVDPRLPESLVDELRTVRTSGNATVRHVPAVSPALLQLVCTRLWPDLPTDPGARPGDAGDASPDEGAAPQDGAAPVHAGDPGDPADPGGAPSGGRSFAAEVDRVLAEHCGQALATVAADHRLASAELASWFRGSFGDPGGLAPAWPDAGMPGAVLRALEDAHLIRSVRGSGEHRYELHHPRLLAVVGRLAGRPGIVRRREPAERLRAAERALCEDVPGLARHHAEMVTRTHGKKDLRILAEARRLLGNIAYEERRADAAADCYRTAANLFEVLQDTRSVGLLLTAAARIVMDGGAAEAVSELRVAANRSPHDPVVQTALSQALWAAGQSRAALAVLDAVLARDGDMPEALRTRGEILADLGEGEPALRDLSRIDHTDRPSTRAAWELAETFCALARPGAARRARTGGRAEHTGAPDRPDPERPPVAEHESGPVLLRMARTCLLYGEAEEAAGLAARAVAARRPPLPPQLRQEAHRLMSPDRADGEWADGERSQTGARGEGDG